MRALLINTPQSPKLRGGDTVQMEETTEALRLFLATLATCYEEAPALIQFRGMTATIRCTATAIMTC
jgi:hypothetical protein